MSLILFENDFVRIRTDVKPVHKILVTIWCPSRFLQKKMGWGSWTIERKESPRSVSWLASRENFKRSQVGRDQVGRVCSFPRVLMLHPTCIVISLTTSTWITLESLYGTCHIHQGFWFVKLLWQFHGVSNDSTYRDAHANASRTQ